MHSETTSGLREYQNKENKIYAGMKCIPAVIEICSGNFNTFMMEVPIKQKPFYWFA